MRAYILRRLLLIPPTLFGITLLVFVVTRFVPGGPVERLIAEMRRGGEGSPRGGQVGQNQALSEEQIDQLKEYYALDKPVIPSYFMWLGVWPRDDLRKKVEFSAGDTQLPVRSVGTREPLVVHRDGEGEFRVTRPDGSSAGPWKVRGLGFRQPAPGTPADAPKVERAELYQRGISGVLTGDLGTSYRYNEPVIGIIFDRLPVSVYYGLMTLVITYLISVPLGIAKAMRHRTGFDNATSTVIFAGYAVPHYALGALLMTWFAARLGWFPTGGFTSYNFVELTPFGKVLDVLHHSVLPLICYLVGDFAFVTMLMKNQLMDNLAADYIRTAVAKGVSFDRAVRGHALRNAFIPVATHLGSAITVFVSGSFLIERVFDINGIGLLFFESVVDRDYPIVLGVILLTALLMLIGHLLSDIIIALVDPRVKFS